MDYSTYDLDFTDVLSVVSHATDPVLIRAESRYPWVPIIDALKGGTILGVTMDHQSPAPKVYLIIDRLPTALALHHVVMHELLHAAGMEHVEVKGSIMTAASNMDHPPLCMSDADRAEFCHVAGCRVEQLNRCAQ